MVRRFATWIFAAFLFASCGGEDGPTRVTKDEKVKPARAKGSIIGQVEGAHGAPLAGATVSVPMVEGVRKTTTDAEGWFTISGLPAGGVYRVRIDAEGHLSASVQATVPADAGEVPLDGGQRVVGPIRLFPNDGRVEIELLGKEGQRLEPPMASCEVRGIWVERPETYNWIRGGLRLPARIEGGLVICEGLPNLDLISAYDSTLTFRWAPIDEDGDGHLDYHGGSWNQAFAKLGEEPGRISRLADPWAPTPSPLILASNVPGLVDRDIKSHFVSPDLDLEILFSEAVTVHSTEMRGMLGAVDPAFEVEVEGAFMRVRPGGSDWEAGAVYELRFAYSRQNEPTEIEEAVVRFLTSSEEELTAHATFEDDGNGILEPGELITIEFNQAIFTPNGDFAPDLWYRIDADIDSSGEIGDADGEWGSDDSYDEFSADESVDGLSRRFSGVVHHDFPAGTEIVFTFGGAFGPMIGAPSTPVVIGEMRLELQAVVP